MGMYTGIRFKGFVKPEFRETMKEIAMEGNWDESEVKEFAKFGLLMRSSFIPCGGLSYMPDEWETDYINEKGEREISFGSYYKQADTDGFERTYNEETGYWAFQCSLKNYESEIETFFNLIPFFIEKIEHLEYFYEEWDWSTRYDLVNGNVVEINDKFVQYNDRGEY